MIVFSHANGFGAGTYRRLIEGWQAAGEEVRAVDTYGHDDSHPIGRNWRGMTQQLLALIDHVGESRVWLVGHSMGGYLSLIAAGQRPDRVRGIVLLDAPVISGWRSGIVALTKALGQMNRVSPAGVAVRRRDRWPNIEETYQYFQAKSAFAAWHPAVLRSYIETGTESDPADATGSARRLRFRREVEAQIYATVPHWLVPYLRRHPLGGPAAFVGGVHSDVVQRAGLKATRRITHNRITWINGSHLFPFEHPDETVHEVLNWMDRLKTV